MKAILYLKDYWWVIPLVVMALAMLMFRIRPKGVDPMELVGAKLSETEAAREAREAKIQLGEERARQETLAKYAERRKALDDEQEARVKSLEDEDLETLARALERATR